MIVAPCFMGDTKVWTRGMGVKGFIFVDKEKYQRNIGLDQETMESNICSGGKLDEEIKQSGVFGGY